MDHRHFANDLRERDLCSAFEPQEFISRRGPSLETVHGQGERRGKEAKTELLCKISIVIGSMSPGGDKIRQ
jgi:hypothetical protein